MIGRVNSRVVDVNISRDGADEANQLLIGGDPHPAVPLREPAGGPQRPDGETQQEKDGEMGGRRGEG